MCIYARFWKKTLVCAYWGMCGKLNKYGMLTTFCTHTSKKHWGGVKAVLYRISMLMTSYMYNLKACSHNATYYIFSEEYVNVTLDPNVLSQSYAILL